MDFFYFIERHIPGACLQLAVGVLAAISRLAYDAQTCNRGWRSFFILLGRQCCLAVTFVAVAHGVTTYYHLDKPISISIVLLSGFFVREIIEQMQIVIKKAPCMILRIKGLKDGKKK